MSLAILSAILAAVLVYFGYTSFLYRQRAKQADAEIAKLSEELDKYAEVLKNWDLQKTEFISIASHQLRTPLAVIQGYIELLQKGAFGELPGSMKEAVNDIEESSTRLVSLVDSLLSVAQIEQGSVDYRFERSNFIDIVETVYTELLAFAESKQVELYLDVETHNIFVILDAEKIRHVVFNFIENAIKYSPSGRVVIRVELVDARLLFTVIDSGCGFEPGEQPLLFEKFYRTDTAKQTDNKGTGLGLYIARNFIEGHRGQIWAKSEGGGKGSSFGFSIPCEVNV